MRARVTMGTIYRRIAERKIERGQDMRRALRRGAAEKEVLKHQISPEQFRAIYANLAGAECVCSANKTRRQSFCRAHYFALPVGLRRQLYDSDGYAETFLRACELLKLTPPSGLSVSVKERP